jgi:hypothetical protein
MTDQLQHSVKLPSQGAYICDCLLCVQSSRKTAATKPCHVCVHAHACLHELIDMHTMLGNIYAHVV